MIDITQETVFKFLQDNDGWWDHKQIAIKLNLSSGSVTNNLKRLRRSDFISFRFNKEVGKGRYEYRYK